MARFQQYFPAVLLCVSSIMIIIIIIIIIIMIKDMIKISSELTIIFCI